MLDKFYQLIRMMVPAEVLGLNNPYNDDPNTGAFLFFLGMLLFFLVGAILLFGLSNVVGFEPTPLEVLGYYLLSGVCYFIITTVLYCKASTKDKDVLGAITNDKNIMTDVTSVLLVHALFWPGSLLFGITTTILFIIYSIARFIVDFVTKKIIIKLVEEEAVEERLKGE